jgi:hypothetical protein
VVETAFPVEHGLHFAAFFQRRGQDMVYRSFFFEHIKHGQPGYCPQIMGLSSACGVKDRFREYNHEPVAVLTLRKDQRFQFTQPRLRVVELGNGYHSLSWSAGEGDPAW